MSNPGDLDTSFGTGGKVITDFPGNAKNYINSLAIQSDGKIIAAGTVNSGSSYDFALARYNDDGTLDGTFGTGGKVVTDFAGGYDESLSVKIQSDGKIVAAGISDNGKFALARYNSDGSLDSSFGTGGKVANDFSGNYSIINSIAIQSDGKIVAGGYKYSNSDFGLMRYNTDGSLDSSFGTGGKVITDFFSSTDECYSVLIQPDGKIIAAGLVTHSGSGGGNFGLVRYNTDGTLDTSFGTGGKTETDFANNYDKGQSVALQSNGKIILGGITYNASLSSQSDNFGLVRYNADGSLDVSFGTSGKVVTDFSGNQDFRNSIVIQSNDKILLSGVSYNFSTGKDGFALVRYSSNGAIDTTFGTSGKVYTEFAVQFSEAYAIAIDSSDRIVLGGYAGGYAYLGLVDFGLMRFIGGEITPVLSICFPAGTPVLTDQGKICIDKIDPTVNTVRGRKVVAITKTRTIEDSIVCIEKNAFGKNIPCETTYISRNHKLFYDKQMVKAKDLVGQIVGVYDVKYDGQILYNVLLETHDKMMVNNIIVETLDPNSIIARLYNGTYSEEITNKMIMNINKCAEDYRVKNSCKV